MHMSSSDWTSTWTQLDFSKPCLEREQTPKMPNLQRIWTQSDFAFRHDLRFVLDGVSKPGWWSRGPIAKRQIDTLYNHIIRAVDELLAWDIACSNLCLFPGAQSVTTVCIYIYLFMWWWTLTSESYQLCIGSLVLAAEAVLFTSSSALRIEMHAEGLVEDLATKAASYLVVSAEIDLPV